MGKVWLILIIILALVIAGIFTFSNTCSNLSSQSCGICEVKIFGLKIVEGQKECALVGGCAGVYYPYWNECCENIARENNISHVQCEGNWTIEDNKCEYECDESWNYTCPTEKTIDCMPSIKPENAKYCDGKYRTWITNNCDVTFAV